MYGSWTNLHGEQYLIHSGSFVIEVLKAIKQYGLNFFKGATVLKSIINDLLVEFPETTEKDMMCIPRSHIVPQENKLVVEKLFSQYRVIRVSLPFLSQDFGRVSHREVLVYWSGTILHNCKPFLDLCNNFKICLTLVMFKFCLIYWWSTIKSPSSKWKSLHLGEMESSVSYYFQRLFL